MKTIKIHKATRQVEFPEGFTKAELVSVILKMVPRVVGDEDKTPYSVSGFDPCELTESETFSDVNSLLDLATEAKTNDKNDN